ncbi:unnamed protein product [Protopolystoma xenopodis]|uniref:Sushi domain-containing protein n=1 Tax=Protopolystoma xenopodis TaxID=117903 RepID=A0A3S5CBT9_9PLAT|nr:unnamed protein product [Protopolystoma xenopodis]
MVMVPNSPNIQVHMLASCQPGMYFLEDSGPQTPATDANVNSSLVAYQYYCTGTRYMNTLGPADPSKFVTRFLYSGYYIPVCKVATCEYIPGLLNNVQSQPQLPNNSSSIIYDFNSVIHLVCSLGYVSSSNFLSSNTSLTCQQSNEDPTKGVWIPPNYQACIPIRCNNTELRSMLPKNSLMLSAQNTITQRIYGKMEANQFNLHGNVVKIVCQYGEFFDDRTSQKNLKCDLAQDSSITGTWYGYAGTILPISKTCVGKRGTNITRMDIA